MNKDFTIVYLGSPEFAVAPLKALLDAGFNIPLVLTQPDKPKGRKGVLTPTAVKEFALSKDIPVLAIPNVNDEEVLAKIQGCAPDLLVVTAFGQLLKEPLLAMAPLGSVNIHASILPEYRGAAPIHQAIMDGKTETGITTMFMEKGLDTGDMLMKAYCDILPNETTGELRDRLADMGADLILETVKGLRDGSIKPEKQNHDLSSYAGKITGETEVIDWNNSAAAIHNKIRGLVPDTSAFCTLKVADKEQVLKIWQSEISTYMEDGCAGKIVGADKKGIFVATGDGILKILMLQPAGKKQMRAVDWWNGQGKKIDNLQLF